MLWRIPADTHVRIGTLPNSFSPSDSLLSDSSSPDRLADNEATLSDDSLMTILRKEENAASNYQWSALSQTREDALDYYDREPYGDEQEGASQVVTSEFADVVESIMPSLMRVFAGTDDVAEFSPGAPGEEQWAKEASAYVPYVFLCQNDGFRILYWLIKDALMYRLGGVTVDIEDYSEKRHVPVQGLPQDAIDLVVAQAAEEGAELAMELEQDPAPSVAVDRVTGLPLPPSAPTFSGTITVTRKAKRVVADNIAPEDILFTPTAREQEKASYLGFRKKVTASELVELGLSKEAVDELHSDRDLSPEDAQRNDSAIVNDVERRDPGDSERPLWLVVAYLKVDVDGDGISETLRCLYAHAGGSVGQIIERIEWEGPASITLATPILMSHTIVGRSLFDQVQDLQQIGSVLTRGLLDNLYLTNRPRPVISDQVNLDSLIDWVPGSPVRLKAGARPGDNHVAWLQVPNIVSAVLPALEYMATVRENRTGIVRNNQGLDADSLNKTATGMNMLMGAAQQRTELIARVFAETAIKRLYKLVYRAIKRAASGPVKYWAGSAFASCDPTKWPDDMALSVNVATGSRDQAISHLSLIGTTQEKLIALQGGNANGPYVTPDNIACAAQKVAETLGYKAAGQFFQPPEKVAAEVAQQAANPAPPAPDPTLVAAQAQIALNQQLAQAEIAINQQKSAARIQLEREEAAAKMQLAREQAALDMQLAREKAALDAQLKSKQLDQEAELEALKLATAPQPGAATIAQQQVAS
jgi:hypothetical protein